MERQLAWHCDMHSDPFDCPDCLVHYVEKFDEYGLIIHDGGTSFCLISHCPWCGTALPESKRDRWFDELAALGFDNPSEQDIPERFQSSEWYRDRG
jgi:hypothetical protein